MEDIAPDLLEQLKARFTDRVSVNPKIRVLYKKIKDGSATYADAGEYAYSVGEALSQVFGEIITRDALPDGRMYYNIADRVIRPMMEKDHEMISEATAMVQEALNRKTGIGIKAQTVAVDEDRIEGIVNKVSGAEQFEDVAWVLDEPLKNFSQAVVDSTLKENVNFHGRSGLSPKIIRKSERKCCKWCSDLDGEFDYPDVPDDVYRRHERCRCVVEYDPGDGRRQNVHTKKLTAPGERDIIEIRKRIGMDNIDTFRYKDYDAIIQQYTKIDRDAVVHNALNGRGHRHLGVFREAQEKTKKQLQKSIISRAAQVEHHAEKVAHPERYVLDWDEKSEAYQKGLIQKWEKDMKRNAEQVEIELAVFEERFLL